MKELVGFTVRIPDSLHKKAKEISRKEHKSINAVVRELLEKWIKEEEQKLLFDAFGKVAESDVEYAFDAEKEVVLSDENSKKI